MDRPRHCTAALPGRQGRAAHGVPDDDPPHGAPPACSVDCRRALAGSPGHPGLRAWGGGATGAPGMARLPEVGDQRSLRCAWVEIVRVRAAG
jgi:hypothetical protein